MAVNSKRGRGRSLVTVVVVACVLLAASFGALAVQAWSGASSASGTVSTQQQGVAYLKPLNLLIGQLVRAQSAAVRGGQADTPDLRNAINAVDTVDRAQDDALSARDRWGALRD